jgi:hypothetical protein
VHVFTRHPAEFTLLGMVDRGGGGNELALRTRFYFDEAKSVAIPADEIDLAAALGGTKIARNHDVSQCAEVKINVFFSARARGEVGGPVRRAAEENTGTVECPQYGPGQLNEISPPPIFNLVESATYKQNIL